MINSNSIILFNSYKFGTYFVKNWIEDEEGKIMAKKNFGNKKIF